MHTHSVGWVNFLICLLVLGTKSDGWGQIITTVAGGGLGEEGPATQALLYDPVGVFVDGAGTLYIADNGHHRIRRVDGATGLITTVAGTGEYGFSGDGGPATQARLALPQGVFVDRAGNLYIADGVNFRVRRVDAVTGLITTVAGTGECGFSGDGGPATQALLCGPTGVFVDGSGHLYIADRWNNSIRRVDGATGIITTVAGTGEHSGDLAFNPSGDGGPATQARLAWPKGVFVDLDGHLYIADEFNIRRVDGATGIITTVAGVKFDFSGDGGPAAQAGLASPHGVFVDGSGHLYIADTYNHRIRRVDGATGIITTVAGTGEGDFDSGSFSGDGGPASQAGLATPHGVFVDGSGTLYIVDTGNDRIRKVIFTTTAVAEPMNPDQAATAFTLAQNYPNPFNPHTRIGYHIAQAGPVSLTIYNLLGQRLRVLVLQPQPTGFYQVVWDGTDATGREVADGVFVYRLASPQGVLAKRMLRLK